MKNIKEFILIGILVAICIFFCAQYVIVKEEAKQYEQIIEFDGLNGEFNMKDIVEYEDLNKAYQKAFTKETFDGADDIWEVKQLLDQVDVNAFEHRRIYRHIIGPVVRIRSSIDQQMYEVQQDLVVSISGMKPVVLSWKIKSNLINK